MLVKAYEAYITQGGQTALPDPSTTVSRSNFLFESTMIFLLHLLTTLPQTAEELVSVISDIFRMGKAMVERVFQSDTLLYDALNRACRTVVNRPLSGRQSGNVRRAAKCRHAIILS